MKDRFTRVLKGMMAVSRVRFPKGTTGAQLDTLARQFLWEKGLDFGHGTGHGVGSYLSVHEGPQRIAKSGNAPLEPGMIISNEPGFYKPGRYGIRIENLILVRAGADGANEFETLTLAPIDKRAIAKQLLSKDERHWLDAYHARVLREVGPWSMRRFGPGLSRPARRFDPLHCYAALIATQQCHPRRRSRAGIHLTLNSEFPLEAALRRE